MQENKKYEMNLELDSYESANMFAGWGLCGVAVWQGTGDSEHKGFSQVLSDTATPNPQGSGRRSFALRQGGQDQAYLIPQCSPHLNSVK